MPVSSSNLMAGAKSYLATMRLMQPAMAEGTEQTSPYIMPFYLLAGFACELAFKSAVFSVHRDERELRDLGHNLFACYERAANVGYLPADPLRVGELVEALGPSHAAHVFRYVPDVEMIEVPNPLGTADALEWLLADIEAQIDVRADLQA